MSGKFELLARWGYAARGVVYGLLGIIALSGALGGGMSGEASPRGALTTILSQPFGRILLGLVAIGLLGHVLWRFAQGLFNADGHEDDDKGYAARAGNIVSGLATGALALAAAGLALSLGGGSDGGGSGEQSISAWLMRQPFGPWLVGAVGLVVLCAGFVQMWRGVAAKYRKHVKLPPAHDGKLHLVCAFGLVARGLLLAVTGGFFVYAALAVDPQQAGSLTDAMDWVQSLPFGSTLYALAALGLVAFGLYSLIEARYRKVDASSADHVTRLGARAIGA